MSSAKRSSHSWKRRSSSKRASRYRNCSTSRMISWRIPDHLLSLEWLRKTRYQLTQLKRRPSPMPGVSLERCPALGGHELCPAPVELPMVAFAESVVARPSHEVRVVALMVQPHLHIQCLAPGDDP